MADINNVLHSSLGGLDSYVALATVDAKRYDEVNTKIIKYLVEKSNTPGVYVTLNKPFKTIQSKLQKAGVDTRLIIFIDAVTKTGGVEKSDECLFIGSPQNLSDISIAMDQAIRALPQQKKFVFFDSLSTLLMYNKPSVVAKFIHFLSGRMRIWKVNGIIISLQKKQDKELIDELSQFCDTSLEL